MNILQSVTIEPSIFIHSFGSSVIFGAQINTDLLIWKLCTKDLNISESVCKNLSLEVNHDAEILVQKKLQEFEMVNQWISAAPGFIYTFFMGALSDKFGKRKPLMLLPQIGAILNCIFYIINYAFLDSLPTEFFYAFSMFHLLGGVPMFWLGAYSFATGISNEKSMKFIAKNIII